MWTLYLGLGEVPADFNDIASNIFSQPPDGGGFFRYGRGSTFAGLTLAHWALGCCSAGPGIEELRERTRRLEGAAGRRRLVLPFGLKAIDRHLQDGKATK